MRANVCFVGSAYDKQDGADIETISEGVPVAVVSPIYLTALDTSAKALAIFFAAAGVQNGL
jgi:hypothetical protein